MALALGGGLVKWAYYLHGAEAEAAGLCWDTEQLNTESSFIACGTPWIFVCSVGTVFEPHPFRVYSYQHGVKSYK